jgi:hypothetical protein
MIYCARIARARNTEVQPSNEDTLITGSLAAVIPLVVGILAVQRFWQGGLTAGGIKG